MMGNVNVGMKRRMLRLGHIIWMMRRTASKTICLLRWQNCGQIIAVKSVACISMAYCAQTNGIDHKSLITITRGTLKTTYLLNSLSWHCLTNGSSNNSDQLPLFQILGYWKRSTRSNQSHARYDAEAKNLFDKSICPILLRISQIGQGCIWRSKLLKFLGKEKRIADGSFQYRGKAGLICGSRERWMGLAGKNINRNWWEKCHGFHKNAFS